jgi:hypothetical protein
MIVDLRLVLRNGEEITVGRKRGFVRNKRDAKRF